MSILIDENTRVLAQGLTGTQGRRDARFCLDYGTKIICGVRSMNSAKFSGRLSNADGSRKPCSTSVSFRERSPSYIPPTCGSVTWDSSTIAR